MPARPFFPIALDLDGKRCAVVGDPESDEVAVRSASLRACGAQVTLLAAGPGDELPLAGMFFVLSTVIDPRISQRLVEAAERYGFLLWCMDQPDYGPVAMMACARAGPLTIATSSSGAAPVVSSSIRAGLEEVMGGKLERFVERLAALRSSLKAAFPGPDGAPERIERMRAAGAGFSLRAELTYPAWFERDDGH